MYKTDRKSNILNHLNRKKKCKKSLDYFNYSDSEIYNLSLVKKIDRENIINKCKYCNKIYCDKTMLNNHLEECKGSKDKEEYSQNEKNTYIKNNQNIENQQNIYIIQNINIPIPFDKDWNTEHIDLYLKQLLLLADNKYTDLLKKILENKSNLNVILDKKNDIGYVYNSNKEYKDMDKREIVNLSMEKLYNHLNKIKDEVVTNDSKILIKNIDEETLKIKDKYNNYINNKNTHNKVEEYIANIYDTNKDEAYKIFDEIKKIKGKEDGY
jgi:hypothetical protein